MSVSHDRGYHPLRVKRVITETAEAKSYTLDIPAYLGSAAVAAEHERPDLPVCVERDDQRAGAVAEQRRRATIVEVDEPGENLRADHQHVARATGLDPRRGVRQGGDRAGAGSTHVDRGGVHRPQHVCHDRRGGGGAGGATLSALVFSSFGTSTVMVVCMSGTRTCVTQGFL